MPSNTRNNFIEAYLKENRELATSLILKFKYAALATNREIQQKYGTEAVHLEEPHTWKYYKNIAGEYHVTDKPMNVVSLDTRDTILFSPENLRLHTATAVAYRQGTRYYRRLLREFPEQEFLINGILTPSDKQRAIHAPDGTILAYRQDLVEAHETTLIADLEQFIFQVQKRWNVEAFALSDPYYATMQAAILCMGLFPQILNLRERRIKTDEVHSFHLREHLASHQWLDRFLPYLTRKQALWLYRNIDYINVHAGRGSTFQALLENILDERMIPLAEYSVRQLGEFDPHGYPVTMARRRTISKAEMAGDVDYLPLVDLYDKEKKTTPGNPRFFEIAEDRITHNFKTLNASVLQTKDLESAMVDLSNAVPDPLPDVLLRQWVSMTHMGLYNSVIHFQDPLTADQRQLLSWDAIIYMYYLTCKIEKIPFDVLPLVANVKFRMHPRPPADSLKRLAGPHMGWMKPIADALVSAQPVLSECFSVTMFQAMSRQVYEETLKHWYLLAGTYDVYARGVMEQMTLKLFGSSLRDFSHQEPVEQWRIRNNLPHYDYTYEQAQALIQEIFSRATGYLIDDTRVLRNIQKALVELFTTLSSYSIQIIREINDTDIVLAGPPHLRYGNVREYTEHKVRLLHDMIYTLLGHRGIDHCVHLPGKGEDFTVTTEHHHDHIEHRPSFSIEVNHQNADTIRVTPRRIELGCSIETRDPVTGQIRLFDGDDAEGYLTHEQFQNLKFLKF